VPLADALRDVALLLEQQRHGDGAVETARLAVHRRTQDAMVQRILTRMDGGSRRRAGGRRIGRREEQPFAGELVHHRRRIADGGAAAVEAGIHPANVVHEEDEDVRFLTGLLLERRQLVARLLVLIGVQDDGVHVVRRLHVLDVHVLLGVAEAGGRGRARRRAAEVLGSFLGEGRRCGDRQRRDERGADGKSLHVGA
jgi:hypothetical protein